MLSKLCCFSTKSKCICKKFQKNKSKISVVKIKKDNQNRKLVLKYMCQENINKYITTEICVLNMILIKKFLIK